MKHKLFIGILPRHQWPYILRQYNVVGVHVGGCVNGGKVMRYRGHAHTEGSKEGWICFRAACIPTDHNLIVHELSHIITRQGHTRKFMECLQRLGAREEAIFVARHYRRLERWIWPYKPPVVSDDLNRLSRELSAMVGRELILSRK